MLLLLLLLQDAVESANLRTYSTPTSIGLEWDLRGDADHDAVCRDDYGRAAGGPRKVISLFRVDYEGWYDQVKADRRYNMFAGSLMFLEPGTEYDLDVVLSDPDGGNFNWRKTIRTRAETVEKYRASGTGTVTTRSDCSTIGGTLAK